MTSKNRKCVGILGGGQLARMSAYQAYKLGFDVAILEKQKNSPAGQLTHKEFVGWVEDKSILKKFSAECDIVTLENEFIDHHYLEQVEEFGVQVLPSPKTISLIQDKFLQKKSLEKKRIPVPKFLEVKTNSTYESLSKVLGSKFIVKSRKLGYDGYGNALVENVAEFHDALKKLSTRHIALLAEEFVNFTKELAVMVVRTKKETAVYPVVETIQKNHVCHLVLAPAQIKEEIKKEADEIAVKCVKTVDGIGIYGIEMFLTDDGKVLVNEMAPRPHNSGHYTIEACYTSQFENHVRAVFGLPLGSTKMVKPYAVMINLLGKTNGLPEPNNLKDVLKVEDAHVHLYGKSESRNGRKLGHITFVGEDLDDLINRAKKAEQKLIY